MGRGIPHHRLPGPQCGRILSSDSHIPPQAHSEDEKTEAPKGRDPGFCFLVSARRVWEPGSRVNSLPSLSGHQAVGGSWTSISCWPRTGCTPRGMWILGAGTSGRGTALTADMGKGLEGCLGTGGQASSPGPVGWPRRPEQVQGRGRGLAVGWRPEQGSSGLSPQL